MEHMMTAVSLSRGSVPEGGGGGRPGLVPRRPERRPGGILPGQLRGRGGVTPPWRLGLNVHFLQRVSYKSSKNNKYCYIV